MSQSYVPKRFRLSRSGGQTKVYLPGLSAGDTNCCSGLMPRKRKVSCDRASTLATRTDSQANAGSLVSVSSLLFAFPFAAVFSLLLAFPFAVRHRF
jgi:hypothetical protein